MTAYAREIADKNVSKGIRKGLQQGLQQGKVEGQNLLVDAVDLLRHNKVEDDLRNAGFDEGASQSLCKPPN